MTSPDMRRRLEVAVIAAAFVALIVGTAIGVNGCAPAAPSREAATPTLAPTDPVVEPTQVPNAPSLDGVWGPGTFTGGPDSCSPPFFGPAYTGTVTIFNNGQSVSIGESQTRTSTGSFSGNVGTFNGSGVIGSQPGNWSVTITYSPTGNSIIAVEADRLTDRNNCGRTYTSASLTRQ
ncbi:MAG: hypothetical protein AB7Q29_17935 [Vicinamibacterales bacterium]